MGFPTHISSDALGPTVYEGSVQRLHKVKGADGWLVSETTESGSVFDVGAFFTLPGADACRATFRHLAYLRLATPEAWQRLKEECGGVPEWLWTGEPAAAFFNYGAATHHIGQIDAVTDEIRTEDAPENPSRFNVIRRFEVIHPEPARVGGRPVFDYTLFRGRDGYVVPLEFLVRFGLTPASSIYRKYCSASEADRKTMERDSGFAWVPWTLFEEPRIDFSTKYEPEDRSLSTQEALLVSGQTAEMLDRAAKMAELGGCLIRSMLAPAGLTLWDLKWEFAVESGRLFFVDTIDTDSLRATLPVDFDGMRVAIHFNKQAMRDYFRLAHTAWYVGVGEAKREAAAQGASFGDVLRAGQKEGRWPKNPEAPEEFTRLQSDKLKAVNEILAGRSDGARLQALGREELAFYQGRGLLTGYAEWNQLPTDKA